MDAPINSDISGVRPRMLRDSLKTFQTFHAQLSDIPHSFQLQKQEGASHEGLRYLKSTLESALTVGYHTPLETARARNLVAYLHYRFKECTEALRQTNLVLGLDGQHHNLVSIANKAVILWRMDLRSSAEEQVQRLQRLKEESEFRYLLVKAKAELAFSYTRCLPDCYPLAEAMFQEVIPQAAGPELWLWKFGLAFTRRRMLRPHLTSGLKECLEVLPLFMEIVDGCGDNNLKAKTYAELALLLDMPRSKDLKRLFEQKSGLKVLRACELALELDGWDHSVLWKCGKMYRYCRQLEESCKLLERAVSVRPTSKAFHNLGLTYKARALEQHEKARKAPADNNGDTPTNNNNEVSTQNETPANSNEVSTQNETPANNNEVSTQNETPANSNEVSTQNETPANSNEVSTQNETPVNNNEVSTQNETPANNNEVSTQNETPVNNNEVSTQNETPANSNEVSTQNETPANSNEVSTQNETPANSNEVSTQNETPANNNEVSTQNETPANNNEVSTQNETPVNNNEVSTQNETPANSNEVSTQNETPVNNNEVSTQNETPVNNNEVSTQNETPANNNEVSTQNETPANSNNEVSTQNETPANKNEVSTQNEAPANNNEVSTKNQASTNNTSDMSTNNEALTNSSEMSTNNETLTNNNDFSTKNEAPPNTNNEVSTQHETPANNTSEISTKNEAPTSNSNEVSTNSETHTSTSDRACPNSDLGSSVSRDPVSEHLFPHFQRQMSRSMEIQAQHGGGLHTTDSSSQPSPGTSLPSVTLFPDADRQVFTTTPGNNDEKKETSTRELFEYWKLVKSPLEPSTPLCREDPFVTETINSLKSAVQISMSKNSQAVYDLALVHRTIGELEEAKKLLQMQLSEGESFGAHDQIRFYEQLGLVLADIAKQTVCEQTKKELLENSQSMLLMALKCAAETFHKNSFIGENIGNIWNSFPALLKAVDSNEQRPDVKLQEKALLFRLIKDHKKSLALLQDIERLHPERCHDPEYLKLCIQNYVDMQQYEQALTFIVLLQRTAQNTETLQLFEDERYLPKVYLQAAKQALQRGSLNFKAHFRTLFYDTQQENICTSSEDTDTEEDKVRKPTWDVHVIHEETEQDTDIARGVVLVLTELCGLRVTRMDDDVMGGFHLEGVVDIMRRTKLVVVMVTSKQKLSRKLRYFISEAACRQKCVYLLVNGGRVPKLMKSHRSMNYPAELLNFTTVQNVKELAPGAGTAVCTLFGFLVGVTMDEQ